MKRLFLALVLALGLFAAAPALASAADSYNTFQAWDGSSFLNEWGTPDSFATPTYGEVIPGNGEQLTDFTFYLNVTAGTVVQAGVYSWNGSRAVTKLWQSGDMTVGDGSTFVPVTVDVPAGVVLAQGQQYVIFLSTLFSTQTVTGVGVWGAWDTSGGPPDPFPAAVAVWDNTRTISDLTGGADWDGVGTGWQLAFIADFAPAGSSSPVAMVCANGAFHEIPLADWTDPNSPYYKAQPAIYVQGYGTMCQLSDLVTYGGNPNSFTAAGYTVNETGDRTPSVLTDAQWSAYYRYYTKNG